MCLWFENTFTVFINWFTGTYTNPQHKLVSHFLKRLYEQHNKTDRSRSWSPPVWTDFLTVCRQLYLSCHKIHLNAFLPVSTTPCETALLFLFTKKHPLPTKNQEGDFLFYLLSSHGFLCCLIHSDLFSRTPTAAPEYTQERIKIQAGSFAQSACLHKAWVMQPLTVPQLGTKLVLALPPPEFPFSQPLEVYLLTSRNGCWLSLKINALRDEGSSSTTDFQVLVTVGLFVHRYQNSWWMAAWTQIGEGIPTNTDSCTLYANEKRTIPLFHVVSLPTTPSHLTFLHLQTWRKWGSPRARYERMVERWGKSILQVLLGPHCFSASYTQCR